MNVEYYLGNTTDESGNSIDDFLSFSDEEINTERNFVPWIFPLCDKSPAYPDANLLSKEDVNRFIEDSNLRDKVKQVTNRYLKYLTNNSGWLNTADHNHFKITRMIKFLSLIRMNDEAKKVNDWCQKYSSASKSMKKNWINALEYKIDMGDVNNNQATDKE